MKVICDNCGAMYKIPDEKLAKPVNKATCRQCGHRMLIPRPRRGADPDERTLVTAVPPTPPPAASRAATPAAPSIPIALDHEEKTAPTGGRGVDETRWVRNDIPARPQPAAAAVAVSTSDPGDRGPALTERAPALPPLKPQPSRQNPPPRSLPAEPQFGDDEVDLDEVATAVEPDPTPTATKRPKPIAAPTPRTSVEAKKPASISHDPRGDLGLAFVGVLTAGLGAVLLAIASVTDAEGSLYAVDLTLSALGTALALGGLVGAGLVLLSGGRGRKPAWRVASVVLGLLAGLGLGGLPAAGRVVYDSFGALTSGVSQAMANATPAPPEPLIVAPLEPEPVPEVAPPAPALEAPVDPSADAAALPTEVPADPPEAPTSTARTSTPSASATGSTNRSAGTSRSTGSSGRLSATDDLLTGTTPTRTLGTTPTSTGKPAPKDLSDDEERNLDDDVALSKGTTTPPPASNLPATPPLAAVDVMIKSNVGIKKCFFEHQRAEGSLPPKIEVKFTIKPTGDTTGYEIKQPKYQGTELESCLIRNMRSITFPPSQQGTTLTFPFVFG